MRAAWQRAAASSLGMLLGCLGADAFLCESDEVCAQGGVQGLCQPSGYCSFPDQECGSGQRYGAHVGGMLAGSCVELEPLTDEGGTTEEGMTPPLTTTGPGTTSPATSTTSPPTTGVDGPVTTEPVGESDTGSTDPSTSGMDEGDDTPVTGAPPEVVCWNDQFDDDMVDGMWCPFLDQGISLDELRGHLRFVLVPEQWAMDGGGGTGSVTTCDWHPLLGLEAVTEVLAVPQVSPYTEAYIEIGNDELRLGIGVLDDELYAFVWNGMGYEAVAFQPYMPAAHRFLRVLGNEEGFVAESSSDGMAWDLVYTEAADLAARDGWAALGTWAEMVPLGPDEATFEAFSLCWLQG